MFFKKKEKIPYKEPLVVIMDSGRKYYFYCYENIEELTAAIAVKRAAGMWFVNSSDQARFFIDPNHISEILEKKEN